MAARTECLCHPVASQSFAILAPERRRIILLSIAALVALAGWVIVVIPRVIGSTRCLSLY